MIFVTVGSSPFPFDRLLDAACELEGELVIQHGASRPPARGDARAYLGYDEFMDSLARAQVVVGHAGVGTAGAALRAGKLTVLVPRLARYGEAVDDHQMAFAHRLAQTGRAVCVEDLRELPATVAALDGAVPPLPPPPQSTLVNELRVAIDEACGRRDGITLDGGCDLRSVSSGSRHAKESTSRRN